MAAEGLHLGSQLGIEPIGMGHGRLEIVDHQRLGDAAEGVKGVLQRPQKIIRGLRERRFAVRLARVAQDDAKDMRLPSLAVSSNDPCAGAEIDLGLFARRRLHTPKRQRPALDKMAHKALHAVVLAGESVVRHEVLPNPLRGELLVELGLNDLAVCLALAAAARR